MVAGDLGRDGGGQYEHGARPRVPGEIEGEERGEGKGHGSGGVLLHHLRQGGGAGARRSRGIDTASAAAWARQCCHCAQQGRRHFTDNPLEVLKEF